MSVQGAGAGRLGWGLMLQRFVGVVTGRRPEEVTGASAVAAAMRARMQDGVEPSHSVLMKDLDRLYGRSLAPEGSVPDPAQFFDFGKRLPDTRGYQALGGMGGDRSFMETLVGRSIVAALRTDPNFRERFQGALGGDILPVGTQDGRLSVHQAAPGARPALPRLSVVPPDGRAAAGGVPSQHAAISVLISSPAALQAQAQSRGMAGVPSSMGPILGGLQQLEQNIMGLAKGLGEKGGAGGAAPTGTFDDVATAVTAQSGAMGLPTDYPGPLSGQPISASMKEALKQSGPEGQQAAAMLAQNAAAGSMSDTARQQMLQHQLNQLKKLYEMLSNILKAMHEAQMEAVRNIT